jgi:cytochrome c553
VSTDPNSSEKPADRRETFGAKAILFIAVSAFVAWGVSFLAMPIVSGGAQGLSPFDAICRAIGITSAAVPTPGPAARASNLVWNAAMLAELAKGDAARGAKIAEDVCASCHFPGGETADPSTQPSIAGQSPRAIYKQLWDLKTGARVSEIMKPIAEQLTDGEMADVAAYYSGQTPRNHNNPDPIAVAPSTVRLVTRGDASRGLAPCAACHAARSGGPLETPNLTGQYFAYTEAQLNAFAAGQRRNDQYARMRTVAAKLTPAEIAELSAYYNAPPAVR